MHKDARVRIYLYETKKGGRRTPILKGIYGGNITFLTERGFDYRCDFSSLMNLGETRDVDIAFLSPEDGAPLLIPGAHFFMREGRRIGEGVVIESYLDDSYRPFGAWCVKESSEV